MTNAWASWTQKLASFDPIKGMEFYDIIKNYVSNEKILYMVNYKAQLRIMLSHLEDLQLQINQSRRVKVFFDDFANFRREWTMKFNRYETKINSLS